MKKIIQIVVLFIGITTLGQECPCVIPNEYKPSEFRIGKTDAIITNPYENLKIANPKYFDFRGEAYGTGVRLTYAEGTILVKKGQKKPKFIRDNEICDDIRLMGNLCLFGVKYIVIGRYEGEGNFAGAVFSHNDKPPVYEIRWSIDYDNGIDVNIQDDDEGGIRNLKLVKFKKESNAKNYSDGKKNGKSEKLNRTESKNAIRPTNDALSEIMNGNKTNSTVNDASLSSNAFKGVGSSSSSNGFSLGNRKVISKPEPKNTCNESGIVVVEVLVDKNGKTIEANAGKKGSTTSASCLLEQAQIAAMNTRWEASSDAPERQVGKISYNFNLN